MLCRCLNVFVYSLRIKLHINEGKHKLVDESLTVFLFVMELMPNNIVYVYIYIF